MTIGTTDATWRRACSRGVVFGLVAASHLALLVAILVPTKPRLHSVRAVRLGTGALRVELLTPPAPTRYTPPKTRITRSSAASKHRAAAVESMRESRGAPPLQASMASVSSATASQPVPEFIAGGGFDTRLQQAQALPATPKLPGGHHYTASDLAFIPVEQQSIKGKVNKIAGLLSGGFDPVCKNVAREQAKTRAQQIADGYTANDLQRMSREHHCQ